MVKKTNRSVKHLQGELGEMLKEFDNLKKVVKKQAVKNKPEKVKTSNKKKIKINDDFFKIGRVSESNKQTNTIIDKKIKKDKIEAERLIKEKEESIKKAAEVKETASSFLIEFDNDALKSRPVKDSETIDSSDLVLENINAEVSNENTSTEIVKDAIDDEIANAIVSDKVEDKIVSDNIVAVEEGNDSFLTIKQKLELLTKDIKDKEIELNKEIKITNAIKKSIIVSKKEEEPLKEENKSKTEATNNEGIKSKKRNPLLATQKKASVKTAPPQISKQVLKKDKEKIVVEKSDAAFSGLTIVILLLVIIAILVAWFTFLK